MKINLAARFHALGDAALTIEFGAAVDRAVSAQVLAAQRAVAAAGIAGVGETVPTFRALAVYYDRAETGFDALAARIGDLDLSPAEAAPGKTWRIPVFYDGPDLAEVARVAGLSPNEVAALHASVTYHVYMLGFLLGFAYLGDLPEKLRLPRLATPRTRVPPGAVAIADQLTAVYPVESPGGWRLIGRTPERMFDPRADAPSLLASGDAVTFVAINEAEFDRLARESSRA